MDLDALGHLLREEQHEDAAALIRAYTIPHVTSLATDVIGHDLAPDTLEVLRGTFQPAGARVVIDVSAAYAFEGKARGALLLYTGQPDEPGAILYDSGGAPLPGVRWDSVASLDGESAWAQTAHRRLVLEVDPDKPVTWQLIGAVIGSSAVVPVAGATAIAITPDGATAFVSSPSHGAVTPVALGRPGYSHHQALTVGDVALAPVETGGTPGRLAADDAHAVVCHPAQGDVAVLSVREPRVLRRVAIPGGGPADCAIAPDGARVVVVTASGRIAVVSLDTGAVADAEIGADLCSVAVSADGRTAYAGDASGPAVHRVDLDGLVVRSSVVVPGRPQVVRVAPDGAVWALCDRGPSASSRLARVDFDAASVTADHALPFPGACDMAIVPVAGQSSEVVRTAWVAFARGGYCQLLIGGRFAGQVHSYHHGALAPPGDTPGGIALNGYGEIWVTQPDLDRVWKWPGGRMYLRCDPGGRFPPTFFGEYCDVAVYGAQP